MAVKISYLCLHFGKTVFIEEIFAGDMIRNKIVNDVLKEICLITGLDIKNLEE